MDEIGVEIFLWVPTVIAYMIKKELDVYLRVPGSSDQNTGLDITLDRVQKNPFVGGKGGEPSQSFVTFVLIIILCHNI